MNNLDKEVGHQAKEENETEDSISRGASEEPIRSSKDVHPPRHDFLVEASEEAAKQPDAPQETDAVVDVEAINRVQSSRPVHTVFGRKQKFFIVFMAGVGAFFSPLSASIYFPALNAISLDLHVTEELVNLTLTTYMILQGLAPTFMGDLADMTGRRPVYILCFVIYIAACIGIAVADNYATLVVVRCIQSTGSSATIALAYGVVADVATSSERGTYMSLVSMGAMAGPAVGPTLGGVLSQFLGWRSIFWFLAIIAGVYLIACIVFFPETARNVVGDGSTPPPAWDASLLNWYMTRRRQEQRPISQLQRTISQQTTRQAQAELAKHRSLKFPNPLKAISIIFEKDSGILLLYNSWVYTAFYCVISSLPVLFQQIYGFNDLQIGLSFIPFGIGCVAASLCNGRMLDYNYRRLAKRAGILIDKKRGEDMRHFPIEKARLQIVFPLLYIGAVIIVLYGWMLEIEAPLAAPLVLLFFCGFFVNGSFNAMSTMLIDLYPNKPSTATAANNLMRCWMGAAGTAVVIPIIDALGKGWAFTLIAGLILVASFMPWVLLKWGPMWREQRRLREENQKKEKEEKERRRHSDRTLMDEPSEKAVNPKDPEAGPFGAQAPEEKTI
ncbi:MAG: hypothetical protein LQ340_003137 [Diploschistes diacapsis]|nr:MAG: hypothetical protein LQ340_003137 [Diploschistes diacapsis]